MANRRVIDFHVHAFPDYASRWVPQLAPFRGMARSWLRPLSSYLHQGQTFIRHVPEPIRKGIDQISGLTPMPHLLVESTVQDLLETMEDNEVDQALVIAHPPVIENDFVLEACSDEPRLLPVVNIPKSEEKPGAALKDLVEKGARALKIHAAADGEGADSSRYKALLRAANEREIPVILHTGCLHSNLLYKDPEMSRAENFEPWFKAFPKLRFVLAHMNWHEPQVAMDLAAEHSNVYVDTSWQPAEIIGEAVRRIGSDRILFGSDWPLVGDNVAIGLQRVQDALETGLMTEDDSHAILGGNAVKLLKLE